MVALCCYWEKGKEQKASVFYRFSKEKEESDRISLFVTGNPLFFKGNFDILKDRVLQKYHRKVEEIWIKELL